MKNIMKIKLKKNIFIYNRLFIIFIIDINYINRDIFYNK